MALGSATESQQPEAFRRPSRALPRVTLRLPMGAAHPAAPRWVAFGCERVEAGRIGERRERPSGGGGGGGLPASFLAVMECSSLSPKQNTCLYWNQLVKLLGDD